MVALAVAFWPDRGLERRARSAPSSREAASRNTHRSSDATSTDEADSASGESATKPAKTWAVRFVGRDQKPAVPSDVKFRSESGDETVIKPTGEVFLITPTPGTISYGKRTWPVRESETVIVLDEMIPFVVKFVDAQTGVVIEERRRGHIDARRYVPTWGTKFGPPLKDRWMEPASWWNPYPVVASVPSMERFVPAFPYAKIVLRVRGPQGAEAGVEVSHARLVRLVRPFAGPKSGGLIGAQEFDRPSWSRIDSFDGASGTSDTDGVLIVSGVPLIHGEVLELSLTRESQRTVVKVALRFDQSIDQDVWFGENTRTPPSSYVADYFEEEEEALDEDEETGGSLAIQVSRVSGEPARNARVVLRADGWEAKHTDVSGFVAFDSLPPGKYEVTLEEPGILFTKETVTVGKLTHTNVTLREPKGWSTRIRVVDKERRPVVAAHVRVNPAGYLGYVDVRDGVQRINHLTGRDGELEIGPLPPGTLRVQVLFGTLVVSERIRQGKEETVIVLR